MLTPQYQLTVCQDRMVVSVECLLRTMLVSWWRVWTRIVELGAVTHSGKVHARTHQHNLPAQARVSRNNCRVSRKLFQQNKDER